MQTLTPEQRRRYEQEIEMATTLKVPSPYDDNPPTYGGLLAFCQALQLLGGYPNLVETIRWTLMDAMDKCRQPEKAAGEPEEHQKV